MNSKALLTAILALSLVGVGAFGILSMDSENSEGAGFTGGIPSGTIADPYDSVNVTLSYSGDYTNAIYVTVGASVVINGFYTDDWNSILFKVDSVTSGYGLSVSQSGTYYGVTYYMQVSGTISSAGTIIVKGTLPVGGPLVLTLVAVDPVSMSFTNPPSFDMVVGDSLNYQATTNIGATFVKESGASWVSVSSSGLVTGTVPSSGEHTFTIKATSTVGPVQTATQTVTLKAYNVLTLTAPYSSDVISNEEFRVTPSTNINANITVSGLPNGAVFTDGVIRWVPLNAGSYSFTITATSTVGPVQTTSVTVNVTVYAKLTFTSVPTADLVVIVNGATAELYSMSTNTTSVLWEFSDGQKSTEFYPVLSFAEGTVTGTLTAFNELGSDAMSFSFDVSSDDEAILGLTVSQILIGLVCLLIVGGALYFILFGGKTSKKGMKNGRKG